MCYHSTYDEKINTLREKWLRIACDDKCSSSEDLLEKDNSVSIPQANWRAWVAKIFSVYTKTFLKVMEETFSIKETTVWFVKLGGFCNSSYRVNFNLYLIQGFFL